MRAGLKCSLSFICKGDGPSTCPVSHELPEALDAPTFFPGEADLESCVLALGPAASSGVLSTTVPRGGPGPTPAKRSHPLDTLSHTPLLNTEGVVSIGTPEVVATGLYRACLPSAPLRRRASVCPSRWTGGHSLRIPWSSLVFGAPGIVLSCIFLEQGSDFLCFGGKSYWLCVCSG